MGHQITAILLKGTYNLENAALYDLEPVTLTQQLTLFHVDQYYSEYWQNKLQIQGRLTTYNIDNPTFPSEQVLSEIVKAISTEVDVHWAIIQTDYFGGIGSQAANAFINEQNISKEIKNINQALLALGIVATKGYDEFDTVGLDDIRHQPDYLEKYRELLDE